MRPKHLAPLGLVLLLGACSALVREDPEADPSAVTVPEAVVQLAAPYQDLTTARLRPEDNCYWYLHTGPVETTLLPLRTAEGRPICVAVTPTVSG